MQRFALGAVDKQLQLFTRGDTSRPVRIGDAGAAHSDQVIAVIEAQLGIGNVNHPADAHHRHLSQSVRAHGAVFLDQRRRVAGIDDRGTQGRAHREVQIIDAASGQFFQQIHGVIEADPRDLHLFWREAVADDKGIVSVLAGHFMGDVENRQREAGAIVAATAPFVVALVGVWRIELLNKVGVGAVNFDPIEAGKDSAADALAKLGDHPLHFFSAQRPRHRGALTRGGDGARRHGLTSANQLRVDHAAAVIDLQNRFRTFRFNCFGDFRQTGDFFIVIDTDSAREGQTVVINKAALNNNGADTAGAGAVVLHQLAGDSPVEITGAGGHRRHQQTVFQLRTIW